MTALTVLCARLFIVSAALLAVPLLLASFVSSQQNQSKVKLAIIAFTGETKLAQAATDTLVSDLKRSPHLQVIEPKAMETAAKRLKLKLSMLNAASIQSLAKETELTHLLSGSVVKQVEKGKEEFVLNAKLVEAGRGHDIKLPIVPRRFAHPGTVVFFAHQLANFTVVKLTGKSLGRLPTALDDLRVAMSRGIPLYSRGVEVVEKPGGKPPKPDEDELTTPLPANDFELVLTVDRPEGIYRVGEEVRCKLRADRDCYIVLYTIDPTGEVNLLLPSDDFLSEHIRREGDKYVSTFKIEGGQTYNVPSAWLGDDYVLTILEDQPFGYEKLFVLASTAPVEMPLPPPSSRSPILTAAKSADAGLSLANRTVGIIRSKPPAGEKVLFAIAEVKFTSVDE